MRYGVIGLGAVGSIIGGLLTETRRDTVLIGKPYQIDIIKKEGIKIIGLNKEIKNIQITSDFSEIKNLDVVFLCVKSPDTETVANQMKKHLKKVLALGVGSVMMGATVLSAMAADLSNFPAPFVQFRADNSFAFRSIGLQGLSCHRGKVQAYMTFPGGTTYKGRGKKEFGRFLSGKS